MMYDDSGLQHKQADMQYQKLMNTDKFPFMGFWYQ